MNFLVAGGTTAAYLYSVVLVILAVSTAEVRGGRRQRVAFFFFCTLVFCVRALFLSSPPELAFVVYLLGGTGYDTVGSGG